MKSTTREVGGEGRGEVGFKKSSSESTSLRSQSPFPVFFSVSESKVQTRTDLSGGTEEWLQLLPTFLMSCSYFVLQMYLTVEILQMYLTVENAVFLHLFILQIFKG